MADMRSSSWCDVVRPGWRAPAAVQCFGKKRYGILETEAQLLLTQKLLLHPESEHAYRQAITGRYMISPASSSYRLQIFRLLVQDTRTWSGGCRRHPVPRQTRDAHHIGRPRRASELARLRCPQSDAEGSLCVPGGSRQCWSAPRAPRIRRCRPLVLPAMHGRVGTQQKARRGE